ncbi:MAG: phage Gp37/Gp68 family protein [Hydrotalea sp.]|nr:phage Gp37/Gp68 family protein [Hydrotalea sp.]
MNKFYTNIQWTDATWNIARGCTKVDADCKFCYMHRDSMNGTRFNPRIVVQTKEAINKPTKIATPSRIFASSLTDVYHEHCDAFRHKMWDIIRKHNHHTYQLLTKRPERIIQQTPPDILKMNNVWFGTSVGSNQGVHRIKDLLQVNCQLRFISFEPLHEDLILNLTPSELSMIHWVIIGGESGNETGLYRYRPCEHQWIENLVTLFKPTAAVFVKQMGTHLYKSHKMSDRHGGEISEFPIQLQIRDFPTPDIGFKVNPSPLVTSALTVPGVPAITGSTALTAGPSQVLSSGVNGSNQSSSSSSVSQGGIITP